MNVVTRKNKGTKQGLYYTKKYLNTIRAKYENFYVLKCDIQKYFYNIDHEILLTKLTKIIKDDEALDIVKNILKINLMNLIIFLFMNITKVFL